MVERQRPIHTIYGMTDANKAPVRQAEAKMVERPPVVALGLRHNGNTLCGELRRLQKNWCLISQSERYGFGLTAALARYRRGTHEDAPGRIVDTRLLAASLGLPHARYDPEDPLAAAMNRWVQVEFPGSKHIVEGHVIGYDERRLYFSEGTMGTRIEMPKPIRNLQCFHELSIITLL